MQQNSQAMNIALSNSVLHRAKPEILSIIDHLIDKLHFEITDLLVQVNFKKYFCIMLLLLYVVYNFFI